MEIVVRNMGPKFDGTYPLDIDERAFTTLEWHWVKQFSGYMPLTVERGFEGGDPSLICALTVIALVRAGQVDGKDAPAVYGVLADQPFDGDKILLNADDDEDDADPLEVTGSEPEPVSGGSGNGTVSGETSEPGSESPAVIPTFTGVPGSDTSATSG